MLRTLSAALLLSVAAVPAGEPEAIFNGRDFAGWTFDNIDPKAQPAETWSVSNGVIVCKGRPPGILRTEREFADYELTLEWRWAAGMKHGNSGVLIHSGTPRETHVWPKSFEIQLAQDDAGDFWTIGTRLAVPGTTPEGRRWPRQIPTAEKPAGQWNALRVRCHGAEVSVWINGVLVNSARDLSARRGAICLQAENGEVRFRNVRVTPLAAAEDSR